METGDSQTLHPLANWSNFRAQENQVVIFVSWTTELCMCSCSEKNAWYVYQMTYIHYWSTSYDSDVFGLKGPSRWTWWGLSGILSLAVSASLWLERTRQSLLCYCSMMGGIILSWNSKIWLLVPVCCCMRGCMACVWHAERQQQQGHRSSKGYRAVCF